MKYLSLVVIFVALISTSFVNDLSKDTAVSNNEEGIAFQDISFQEALAKAKKENKLVFLDAYTSWCGPCKMLEKTTFKSKEVGKVFNKHFVNIHIDMEKGNGPNIARKYQVRAYPTLLILKPNGQQVKRMLGYMKEEQLLAGVKEFVEK